MNIKLTIEYDGTDFHGWQRQAPDKEPSIQGTIENGIEKILGYRVPLIGASRTDSGVHACGQVANFLAEEKLSPLQWQKALNYLLPHTIRILDAEEVAVGFHAIRDARRKTYEYRVLNRLYGSALDRRSYFFPRPLDWERIESVLPKFVGRLDYRSFQGAKAATLTSVREVLRFELLRDENVGGLYRFLVEGRGFLKQMVRAMVGTVLDVGEHKIDPSEIETIFASRKRSNAGPTVPACGLFLVKVDYDN